jgi:hypothetical protein
MLPLFRFIDEERIKNIAESNLVKKRPTFHYRMPNCKIDDNAWSIAKEWERWCVVEQLAQNDAQRKEMMGKYFLYVDNHLEFFSKEWLKISSEYFE